MALFGTECCHMCHVPWPLPRVFLDQNGTQMGYCIIYICIAQCKQFSFLQHGHLITVAYFFFCGIQCAWVVLSFFQVHMEVSADVSGEKSGN